MTDTPDRAEAAFRDAFAAHDDHDLAPLDPDALRAAASRAGRSPARRARRPWLPLAAAAGLVALAVPVGVQLLGRSGSQTASSGVPAAAPRHEAADKAGGVAPASGELLPGFRWASMVDVVVQVPAAWGYDRALGRDWCAAGGGDRRLPGDPALPFVDVRPEGRTVRAIGCPDDVPAARQTMHLTWRHADSFATGAVVAADGWTRVSREVGSAVLTVVAPLDQRALAEQILGSAHQVAVDHNGCATAAPVGPGAPDATPPVAGGAVGPDAVADGAVLCQYDDLTRTAANLVGSRVLDAATATGLLRAMAAGGPVVPRPAGQCVQDDRQATLVVIQPRGTGGRVWLRVPGCDPSVVQDGRSVVAASTAVCAVVFAPPLALPDGGTAGDACFAARFGPATPSPTR